MKNVIVRNAAPGVATLADHLAEIAHPVLEVAKAGQSAQMTIEFLREAAPIKRMRKWKCFRQLYVLAQISCLTAF